MQRLQILARGYSVLIVILLDQHASHLTPARGNPIMELERALDAGEFVPITTDSGLIDRVARRRSAY